MNKIVYEKDGKTTEFNSQKHAASVLGISERYVSEYIRGKKTPEDGSKWYIKEIELERVELPNEDLSLDPQVATKLTRDERGNIEHTIENIYTYLDVSNKYKGRFNYNEWSTDQCILSYDSKCKKECFHKLEDSDMSIIRRDVEKSLGFYDKSRLDDAITNICIDHSYHPILNILDGLTWDGKKRKDRIFIKYLGATDSPLTEKLTRLWLWGLMKRTYEPGCYFDYMLIMCDPKHGTGKSKLAARLALDDYYVDKLNVTDKDAIDIINNCMIVNFDELDKFDKASITEMKTFISESQSRCRLSYDRRSKVYPRHCVFYGTTNETCFLKDYTNDIERRYWILECNGVSNTEGRDDEWWRKNLPNEEIFQILAEARDYYFNNKDLSINFNGEEYQEMLEIQLRHKTYKKDAELELLLESIINFGFTEDEMKSYFRFKNIVKEIEQGRCASGISPIEKIPVKYLSAYCKKSENYITRFMIDLGWRREGDNYVKDTAKNSQTSLEL